MTVAIDTWKKNNNGDWSTASNWTLNAVPKLGDVAVIQGGTVAATDAGTINSSIYLEDGSSFTLNTSNLGLFSILVSSASNGTNSIELADRTAAGNPNAQSNELHGTVLGASGTTNVTVETESITMNDGLIAAANPWAAATVNLSVGGAFENNGELVAAGRGVVNVYSGYRLPSFNGISSSGLIEAIGGGTLTLNGAGPLSDGSYLGGSGSSGLIEADDGTVIINSNIYQTGTMEVSNGGTLSLLGTADGGTIIIRSGMLDIASSHALSTFDVPVAFTGRSGSLEIDGASISNLMVQELGNHAYNPILTFQADYGNGDVVSKAITLDPSRGYATSDFTVTQNGSLIGWHPTT